MTFRPTSTDFNKCVPGTTFGQSPSILVLFCSKQGLRRILVVLNQTYIRYHIVEVDRIQFFFSLFARFLPFAHVSNVFLCLEDKRSEARPFSAVQAGVLHVDEQKRDFDFKNIRDFNEMIAGGIGRG